MRLSSQPVRPRPLQLDHHKQRCSISGFYNNFEPASMASETCAHRDIQQFDNLRCCMSCGETLYLWLPPQGSEHIPPAKTHSSTSSLAHTYSDLRLSTGNAIRLVVLLPGSFTDPICCTIATVDPYKERYDALSYTWATEDGEDRKTGRIHCHDGVIPVTENCEAALRTLRFSSAPRQLWVDAISIDQTNIDERNHQVGMMGTIFRLASTVHICIQDSSRRYTEGINWLKSETFFSPEPISITQIREVFRRRYFSRVWVWGIDSYLQIRLLTSLKYVFLYLASVK
jgi:hypothetical protein